MAQRQRVSIVSPGQWLGVMGGGQLGRMFCQAAQSLGYKVAVLDPGQDSPAGAVADWHLRAHYDDQAALVQLSQLCQAITTEFENVPAQSLHFLARHSTVSPSADSVAIVQNRIQEKAFIQKAGVPVAPYVAVESEEDLERAPGTLFPGILKAARLGYDGKGQARIHTREEAVKAFLDFGRVACVLEAFVPLKQEISVVMARGWDDHCVFFPPVVNVHLNGILAMSMACPDRQQTLSSELVEQARLAAFEIAKALDYRGVLCVEFFVLQDGRLLANEVAPRPHNSGHHTIDACLTSQFEQQVRVMAGMPLGSTQAHSASVMLNVLGNVWFDEKNHWREPNWAAVLAVSNAKLHLYGKTEARPDRKMGHVTLVAPTIREAQTYMAQVANVLGLPC